MSEQETITVPAAGDTGIEPPAQETPPAAQAAPEPQTAATTQVESGSKEPQVPEATRRRPSDYYRERQTIRDLKNEVESLRKWKDDQARLKDSPPVAPEVPDFDPAHFSPEHKRILAAREKALRDAYDAKINALEQRISGWQESQAVAEEERQYQGALEKLFPKASPDSKESLNERMAKDPDRAMRIREILLTTGANEMSKKNPDKAVEFVLMELGEGPKAANPTVLKKGLMAGTPSGSPGAGKRTTSESDLSAEIKKLKDQLDANPSLRQDVKFMERRRQVMDDLERLVTKN